MSDVMDTDIDSDDLSVEDLIGLLREVGAQCAYRWRLVPGTSLLDVADAVAGLSACKVLFSADYARA